MLTLDSRRTESARPLQSGLSPIAAVIAAWSIYVLPVTCGRSGDLHKPADVTDRVGVVFRGAMAVLVTMVLIATTMARDKATPFARMEITSLVGHVAGQIPDPVPPGPKPRRVAFTRICRRALNSTLGGHPCCSRATCSTAVAGRGPSSSAENKNSWRVSAGGRQPASWGRPGRSRRSQRGLELRRGTAFPPGQILENGVEEPSEKRRWGRCITVFSSAAIASASVCRMPLVRRKPMAIVVLVGQVVESAFRK